LGVDFSIQEDHFSLKYSNNYDLFIIFGMNRFSFLIGDNQSNLLVLKSYTLDLANEDSTESLKEVYIQEELLKLPYRSVKIGLINNEHTFIPDRLFNAEDPQAYLDTMVKDKGNSNIHVDRLASLDSRQVYQVDKDLEFSLQQYFPTARLFHVLSPLVLGLKQISSHQGGKKVYVHVRNQQAHIFLFEDDNFLFANSFTYQTDKDFIYFTMLVYDQFKLDASIVPLYYSGFILENSQLYHQLYRYIRFLNPVPRPLFFKYGKKSTTIKEHFFFDLYSLKLCE
jgi:hypothetical protein